MGSRTRPGGRSARVRRAVLDATLDVLVEQGSSGVSIGRVAELAGVAETSIYRRWGRRENLVVDALLDTSEDTVPTPDTGTLRGDLEALVTGVATFLTSPRGLALARSAALEIDDATLEEARRTFWDARARHATTVVDRAIDRAELPEHTDPRLVLETLVAPLYMRVLITGAPVEDDLPHRLVDLVLHGVGSGEPD